MKTISHSGLRLWRNCQRQYRYAYIDLRVPVKVAATLMTGRIWDRALEAWHHEKTPESRMLAACAVIAETQDTTLRAKLEAMMLGYTARWGSEPIDLVATQVSFTVPIVNPITGESHPDYEFTGILDAVIRKDGRLLGFESKSSGEDIALGSPFWQKVTTLDPQASMYLLGAPRAGHPIESVLYDVARKPDLRLKKDETTDEYRERCALDINARPEHYYQRHELVRLEHDAIAYEQDLWDYATALADAERTGRYPRNPDHCRQYGRVCEYVVVCAGEGSIDDPVLYRKKEKDHGPPRQNPNRTAA